MKIVFTGGGSGGHLIPIIAIARQIKKIYPEYRKKKTNSPELQFYFVGPEDKLGQAFLNSEKIKINNIFTGKFRRYFNPISILQNIFDIFVKVPIGIGQAFFYLFIISPDLVFSKGGYGAVPTVIAAKILLIPIFMHESDSAPGFTNKFLRKFALEIFTSFPKTENFSVKKLIAVGNPIREEVLSGNREKAKEIFNLSGQKPIILILGGSQGARRVNDKILEILPLLLDDFEIIHQCGQNNYQAIKKELPVIIKKDLEPYYHLYAFLKEEEMAQAYAAADLIISRAGSGSIFEIAAVGKPAILVPLPESAQDHQLKNSYAYQNIGAGLVMEENNFTPHFLLEKLKVLFKSPKKLKEMSDRAKRFSRPQAARIIAHYILEYITQ